MLLCQELFICGIHSGDESSSEKLFLPKSSRNIIKAAFFIYFFFFAHVNNEYALQPSALVDRGNPAEATHQEDGGNHPSVQRGKT